jgi:hypothetical protein
MNNYKKSRTDLKVKNSFPQLRFTMSSLLFLVALLRSSEAFTINSSQSRSEIVVRSSFLKGAGDFFRMGSKEDRVEFGPSVILLGGFPMPISTVKEIIQSAAPQAWDSGITVRRVDAASAKKTIGALLEETDSGVWDDDDDSLIVNLISATPVVYFSGICNDNLRVIARGLVGTLFQETGAKAAVAKLVPPAMTKTVGGLFQEVSGDHLEALAKGFVDR